PGLEISVHEALLVRAIERVRDLDGRLEELGNRERAAREAVREGLAFQMLHDQVLDAVLMTDIEERADVRMVEARDDARFAFEALPHFFAQRQVAGKDFDRDGPVEAGVARAVDLAHASGTEEVEDFVSSEPGSGGEAHG